MRSRDNAVIKVELETVAYAGNAAFFPYHNSMGSFLFVSNAVLAYFEKRPSSSFLNHFLL